MKKRKNIILGMTMMLLAMLAKAPIAKASEYKVTAKIHKEQAESTKITQSNRYDIHFLWEESIYKDENGKQSNNVLKNHPAFWNWVQEKEEDGMNFEKPVKLDANQAAAITQKLGATNTFKQAITQSQTGQLVVPELDIIVSNNCYVRDEFVLDTNSVDLNYHYAKSNSTYYEIMNFDKAWYYPTVKGVYKLTLRGGSNEVIGYMEIPVRCEINYRFKTKDNLASDKNAGDLYVWDKMGIGYEESDICENLDYRGLDAEWFVETYYKKKNVISVDYVLEPGERIPLKLANQKSKITCNQEAQDIYYLANENGARKCKPEELPISLGYNKDILAIDANGIATAKKEGVARVDVYYTSNGTHLVYKITVRQTAKKVNLKKVKASKGKKVKVSWSKCSGVTGYELQYASNSKFKKAKKVKLSGKKTSYTLKNIKWKKCYVRIRSYKKKDIFYKEIENGWNNKSKQFNSVWSDVKKVSVKK